MTIQSGYTGLLEETERCAALQDVVTRGGKFLFLYKRPGHRVIINSLGVMMVSPSAMETSVQQYQGGMAKPLAHQLHSAAVYTLVTVPQLICMGTVMLPGTASKKYL